MFTPIDLTTWPRREHFHYYRNLLPVSYTLTVRLDVTRFRSMLRDRGLKFYPSFIWAVSQNILTHPAFRMGLDGDGNPGHHDVMHPNYTIFHEDDKTFSDVWAEHSQDFSVFYQRFLDNQAQYGTVHGIKARPGQPGNFYCISCVPWLDFASYSNAVAGSKPALFPIFTYGKITEEHGKATMPVALTIAHAAADGYHSAEFFNDLQALLDAADLTL